MSPEKKIKIPFPSQTNYNPEIPIHLRECSEQLSRIEDLPQKENIDGSPHRFVSVLPQLGSNPVQRSSLSQGPKNPLRWHKFSQDAVPLTPSFFHCSGVPEILQSWFFIHSRKSLWISLLMVWWPAAVSEQKHCGRFQLADSRVARVPRMSFFQDFRMSSLHAGLRYRIGNGWYFSLLNKNKVPI